MVSGSRLLNLGKSITNHAQYPLKEIALCKTLPSDVFHQVLLIYQGEYVELVRKSVLL